MTQAVPHGGAATSPPRSYAIRLAISNPCSALTAWTTVHEMTSFHTLLAALGGAMSFPSDDHDNLGIIGLEPVLDS